MSRRGSSAGGFSNVATPTMSPSQEVGDPFDNLKGDATAEDYIAANSTVTSLAAYLTTISNDAHSTRAERAIKRVRSDLAAHSSPGHTHEAPLSLSQVLGEAENMATSRQSSTTSSFNDSAEAVEDKTVEGVPQAASVTAEAKPATNGHAVAGVEEASQPKDTTTASAAGVVEVPSDVSSEPRGETTTPVQENADQEEGRSTPVPESTSRRLPRSQSAEPTSRGSRIYASTVSSTLRGKASQASMTGDDSSVSTSDRRSSRKKRSKSTDPHASSTGRKSQRKVAVDDFEMMRVLGKGCAGKVLLVRHRPTHDVFALKAITKRHVLAHQELQHTLTEQAVLKRMAAEGTDPFVVKLWWSFHDKENLFLVMDFHPGGDLATQLARWGRLGRDRARFYAAEIVEGVEGLHAAGVIYRDLKPENILIGADGHIVLTDFGLSKEFPRRTNAITAPPTPSGSRTEFFDGVPSSPATPHWMKGEKDMANPWTGASDSTSTFCGTAEYLAPEVIQGLPYSYEVDWWSFGTMLYEMLTGITPFWANNHSDMYYRVLQDELQFPEDRTMDQDTKSLIRGLLQRNPALRMKEPRIKRHPYFSMIDWSHVYHKRYIPPYIPPIDPTNASDTQNFDDTFLDMEPVINDDNDEQTDTDQQTDTDRTDGDDSVATPSQSRSPSVHPAEDDAPDVFDGYSFKGRHSIILDEEDEEGDGDESGEDEEDEEDAASSIVATELDSLIEEEPVQEDHLTNGMDTVAELPEPTSPEEVQPTPAEEVTVHVTAKPELPPKAAKEAPEVPKKDVKTPSEPAAPKSPVAPKVPEPEKPETILVKAPIPRAGNKGRGRREKSGIPALDRDIADEDEVPTERDEDEDDDWDFVDSNVDEERNGTKATSLFARGVVDRYKLVVFRKSTPRRSNGRNHSTISNDAYVLGSPDASESPTPTEKHRRGRNPGLTFRRNPKEFLRQRSPTRTASASTKSVTHSASATLSTVSSTAGQLSASPSMGSTLPVTPSLKSKESAISVGTPSESSDQSVNGDAKNVTADSSRVTAASVSQEDKQKSKGLKKYKEGAEKVLSIFQSPR
ncbi:hypothetical protein NM688_g8379 [Phlebia brevispora]|uniref:Uncharacterized protein n=1 Tax=Phlebia brevispora TaxID=194682 RepID=A0ACC1RS21_9APHY|nr:hypothetical protein NM688_g8379 [Phlebia brevispora]